MVIQWVKQEDPGPVAMECGQWYIYTDARAEHPY